MKNREEKLMARLYEEYLTELIEKFGIDLGGETAESILKQYEGEEYEVIPINEVGFLIAARPPDCHPMCDRFICQAYISPEFRGKGLMADTVREYVGGNKGNYCLDILDGNRKALEFWKYVFSTVGYEQDYFPPVDRGLKDMTTYFFVPRG